MPVPEFMAGYVSAEGKTHALRYRAAKSICGRAVVQGTVLFSAVALSWRCRSCQYMCDHWDITS